MKEEIELLLKRARIFREHAEIDYRKSYFDFAMFHLEQAAQLMIKAKLLDLKGSFQKTHLLRELLSELAESWKNPRISEFIEKNKTVLRDLERAYISSRYIYEEFFREEVEKALKMVKELEELLWKE